MDAVDEDGCNGCKGIMEADWVGCVGGNDSGRLVVVVGDDDDSAPPTCNVGDNDRPTLAVPAINSFVDIDGNCSGEIVLVI